MSTTTEKTQDKDELLRHRRALGSIRASKQEDVARVKRLKAELAEAINRLNGRYVDECARVKKVSAGGEDPGLAVPPGALVGVTDLPMLLEHPPRRRANLRRTPEQLKREEERRLQEAEEYERGDPLAAELGRAGGGRAARADLTEGPVRTRAVLPQAVVASSAVVKGFGRRSAATGTRA